MLFLFQLPGNEQNIAITRKFGKVLSKHLGEASHMYCTDNLFCNVLVIKHILCISLKGFEKDLKMFILLFRFLFRCGEDQLKTKSQAYHFGHFLLDCQNQFSFLKKIEHKSPNVRCGSWCSDKENVCTLRFCWER